MLLSKSRQVIVDDTFLLKQTFSIYIITIVNKRKKIHDLVDIINNNFK